MNEKADSIADAIMSRTPRRAHIEKNIPAELAIRNAMTEVEKLGAHPGLTYAVIHLHDALTDVADWYDNGSPGAYQPADVSLTDKVCADPNIDPAFKAALTAK
jgi:hypothetical protein